MKNKLTLEDVRKIVKTLSENNPKFVYIYTEQECNALGITKYENALISFRINYPYLKIKK